MAKSKFNHVKVSGISTVVPENVKCIDDEVDLYGGNEKQIARIKKAVGLNKRHVVDEHTTTLDLCIDATKRLFEELKVDKEQIDGLIFVTQTPDHFQPANAAIAHGKLELNTSAASFDVSLGCSGYVYGLWLAHMMVETGACSNVLLLAGDTLSRCVNERDRSTAPLFGDAGTATLVQRSDVKMPSYFSLHTDGSGSQHIMQPAGAFRTPFSEVTRNSTVVDEDGNHKSQEDLLMNGAEVFNFSIKVEPPSVQDILEFSQKSIDDINYVFFHQANQYIISNIARRLKLPKEKAPSDIVSHYGNQSSASIPCAICHVIPNSDKPVEQESVLSGFGVGLSWASAVLSLQEAKVLNVNIYNK